MIKLKNCPKCGGDYIISDTEIFRGKEVGFVECCSFVKSGNDDACMEIVRASTEEEAREKWNRLPRKVR